MRIIELRAENIKRLVAVDIKPNGDLVEIAGPNAAGKTSVLDAIWWGLAGDRATQEDPIRHGTDHATVELDLGELKIERTWVKAGEKQRMALKVTMASGVAVRTPQAILDGLLGKLTFDPLEFSRMKPGERRNVLMEVIGLRSDLEVLERERAKKYEERRVLNRTATELKAAALKSKPEGEVVVEAVSVANLMVEFDRTRARQNTLDTLKRKHDAIVAERKTVQRQIEDLMQTASDLMAQAATAAEAFDAEAKAGVFRSIEQIKQDLLDAEGENELFNRQQRFEQMWKQWEAVAQKAGECEKELAEIDSVKQDVLLKAPMPVADLGFSDGDVTYHGVPFDQASAAEKLRVSVAIGMSLNPKLRVLRITDGSLLDHGNLAVLEQMAREHDFQVWIERVEAGTEGAVIIEEGVVRT